DGLPQRAVARLAKLGVLQRPEHEAALALARLSASELLRTRNFGRTSLNALCAWLAHHGLAFAEHPKTEPGAPMRERPSNSETDPLPTGRNMDETRCPYTTKTTYPNLPCPRKPTTSPS